MPLLPNPCPILETKVFVGGTYRKCRRLFSRACTSCWSALHDDLKTDGFRGRGPFFLYMSEGNGGLSPFATFLYQCPVIYQLSVSCSLRKSTLLRVLSLCMVSVHKNEIRI